MRLSMFCLTAGVLWIAAPLAAETWKIDAAGVATFPIDAAPEKGVAQLPTPAPNITRAYWANDRQRTPLTVEFNTDATAVSLHLGPDAAKESRQGEIVLETAEKSTQFADGRIVFSALDAQAHGQRAKLETHPGNHRVGYWTVADDYLTWDYKPTRPGTYAVELTFSLAGGAGTRVAVQIGEQTLEATLPTTGSWYRYTVIPFGVVKLTNQPTTIKVSCLEKKGGAVMNFKALTLRPTCEGAPPTQAENGEILCHSRDATIHGVRVQYEPLPHKNTVGCWTNPADWVSWDFEVETPGKFDVEVLQGCGKGAGGSDVEVRLGEQKLNFTVEDTGHFQNFKPRVIGAVDLKTPGTYTLEIHPVRKAGVAVMDVRQVRLVPAEAAAPNDSAKP